MSKVTDHLTHCRSGCLIDDMRFCPAVPADWAEQYRERALEIIRHAHGEQENAA